MKNGMTYVLGLLAIVVTLAVASPAQAQCPMCKSNVEAARKTSNPTVGNGLNTGIIFLMGTPYLLVMVGGYFWFRQHRRKKQVVQHGTDAPGI